jgi:peroxiredoxin family protein
VIVCSAGLEYMDIDKTSQDARKDSLIDDVWGLPQVLTMVEGAETVLYI